MSVFKKIRNFLGKDEVRAGLAIGSGLAGLGAFDNMKYGNYLTTGLGGLNVASGLSAGGVSGALQAGLGGYGLAQGMGKVGTFQDTYRSLFGGGGQAQPQTAMPSITGPGNPNLTASATGLPPSGTGIGERPFAQTFANSFDTDGTPLASRSNQIPRMEDDAITMSQYSQPNNPAQFGTATKTITTGTGPGNPNLTSSGTGVAQLPSGSRGGGQFNPPNVVPGQNTVPGGGVGSGTGNMLAQNNNQMMVTAGGKSVPSFIVNGQQVVIGENGLVQPAAEWVRQNTEGKGFSFKGVMDNIAQRAMDDPMQAVSVGAALVTAFAESPQEQAARLYAEEVARVRAQTDPNSDFGQTFMNEYTTQRQDELTEQYATAKADWVSTMSARGLTDSTIATEGLASLDAKFAELQSKLPMDAMMALQQYQNNMFKNLNLGLGPAEAQAKLMASQSNPFSLATKGAVQSVGS